MKNHLSNLFIYSLFYLITTTSQAQYQDWNFDSQNKKESKMSISLWVSLIGDPNPNMIIAKSYLKRDNFVAISTSLDNKIWNFIAKKIPIQILNHVAKWLILPVGDNNDILLFPCTISSPMFKQHKNLAYLGDFAKINQITDYKRFGGSETMRFRAKIAKEYSGNACTSMKDSCYLTFYEKNTDNNLIVYDKFLPITNYCQSASNYCGEWIICAFLDTMYIPPISLVGQQYQPNYGSNEIVYKIQNDASFPIVYGDYFVEIDYLNWYESRRPKGYLLNYEYPKTAYFLDTLNNILVIGEQNPKTGEWQGNFEAYLLKLAINTSLYSYHTDKPMLFLKGQYDKNKRVGEWFFYLFPAPTDFYELQKNAIGEKKYDDINISYIDASGKFLRSETKPFVGFSAAELYQFEQVVKPILETEKK